jgi:hypothetical protein
MNPNLIKTGRTRFLASVFAFGAASVTLGAAQTEHFYPDQIDGLKQKMAQDPEIKKRADVILAEANRILTLPLVKRAFSLDQLKDTVTARYGGIDHRTYNIEKSNPAYAEQFALAMSDSERFTSIELPLLAAAYRITNNPAFLERIKTQLEEMTTWTPFQRSGWARAGAPSAQPGGDGVWLATGLRLLAICQTEAILPPEALPAELKAKLRAKLEDEINRICKDWKDKRPWYVQAHASGSNQWVVPSCALVIACATVGRESHSEAYALGIKNLSDTLATLGDEGACPEGIEYGKGWVAPFLFLAARSMADAGDNQFLDRPFFKNFPTWLALGFQPGGNLINCFDGSDLTCGSYNAQRGSITQLAALSRDPRLFWILRHNVKATSIDLYGLQVLNFPAGAETEPPLWGNYTPARWVVWRSSWADDASGVWVRGGSPTDFHDHNDRGHVNFIGHGENILIDAGTPDYSDLQKHDKFDSVLGANVLQVGTDLFPTRSVAPLTVKRLDATGGDVTVEAGTGYQNVTHWTRHVIWTAQQVEVDDDVALSQPEDLLFRWNFGSEQPLQIAPSPDQQSAEVKLPAGIMNLLINHTTSAPFPSPAVNITVTGQQPLVLTQEKNIDHTVSLYVQHHEHTTLVVHSQGPVRNFTVKTVFDAK